MFRKIKFFCLKICKKIKIRHFYFIKIFWTSRIMNLPQKNGRVINDEYLYIFDWDWKGSFQDLWGLAKNQVEAHIATYRDNAQYHTMPDHINLNLIIICKNSFLSDIRIQKMNFERKNLAHLILLNKHWL